MRKNTHRKEKYQYMSGEMKHSEYLKKYGIDACVSKCVKQVLEEVEQEPVYDLQDCRDRLSEVMYVHSITATDIYYVAKVFAELSDRGIRPYAVFQLLEQKKSTVASQLDSEKTVV